MTIAAKTVKHSAVMEWAGQTQGISQKIRCAPKVTSSYRGYDLAAKLDRVCCQPLINRRKNGLVARHQTLLTALLNNKIEALERDCWGGRSAVKAKTQAINQLRALLVSAPQDIRERLLKTKTAECVANCVRLRSLGNTPMLQTLASTLRLLAKRYLALA